MYNKNTRSLTQWKTHDIKDRMVVLKQNIDEMELEMTDPYAYISKRRKDTLKGVQARYSEMEKELQKRSIA